MAINAMNYTVEIADKLRKKLKHGYNVYYSSGSSRENFIKASLYSELDELIRLAYIDILITRKYSSDNEEPIIMIKFEGTQDSSKIIGDLYSLLIADYIHPRNIEKAFQLNHEEYIIVPVHIKPYDVTIQKLDIIRSAIKKKFNLEETERIWLLGYSDPDVLSTNTEKFVFDYIEKLDRYDKDREKDWEKLFQIIEECTIDTGIKDLASEHDHYLYGTPKKNA